MKVLVTSPLLSRPGGVAGYLNVLSSRFTQSVDYLTVGSRSDNETRSRAISNLVGDYLAFYKKLKGGGHDIVHLNPSLGYKAILRDSLFLLIAKLLGKKVVVFIHGWDHNCERIIRKYCLHCFRFVYFRADAFIVLAKEFKDKLIGMGCDKEIFLETTVVDDTEVPGPKLDLNKGQGSGRIGENFNILVLTRIDKGKGVYESIDAYRRLKSQYPDAVLTIAGDGPELEGVKGYAQNQEISDVEFLGYITGEVKREALIKADVYIFPSHGEGMPTTVLEAMAYGLPVITRPVGGIKDFFEDGRMGFLTESLDPSVFAELLEKLILNPDLRLEVGKFNREYAYERFVATKVVARIEKIYQKVLDTLE